MKTLLDVPPACAKATGWGRKRTEAPRRPAATLNLKHIRGRSKTDIRETDCTTRRETASFYSSAAREVKKVPYNKLPLATTKTEKKANTRLLMQSAAALALAVEVMKNLKAGRWRLGADLGRTGERASTAPCCFSASRTGWAPRRAPSACVQGPELLAVVGQLGFSVPETQHRAIRSGLKFKQQQADGRRA